MAKPELKLQVKVEPRWYVKPLFYLIFSVVRFGFDANKASSILVKMGYKITFHKD